MGKESLRELLVGHYNELLPQPMTGEEEARYLVYLFEDAPWATVEQLPAADPVKTGYYGRVDDFLEKGKKKENIGPVLRFAHLIHTKGASGAFVKFISSMLEYSYKGIREEDFFFPGSLLGTTPLIEYYLYELQDQIHDDELEAAKKRLEALHREHRAEFEAIATDGAGISKLSAAAFLYPGDPQRYGPCIDAVLPPFVAEGESELLFNCCGLTGFEHPSLRQGLREAWQRAPGRTCDRIVWNKCYFPQFLDKSLFRKDYPPDDHPPCAMDYLRKVAKAVDLPDKYLLMGIYYEVDHQSDARYLAEFLGGYPRELILEVFEALTPPGNDNSDRFLRLRTLFGLMKMDLAPVRDRLMAQYDGMLEYIVERCLTEEDDEHQGEGEAKRIPLQYYREVRAFLMEGDDSLLPLLAEEEVRQFLCDRMEHRLDDLAVLCGSYAEEEALRERVHRLALLMAHATMVYRYVKFIASAIEAYNWDGKTIVAYFCVPQAPLHTSMLFLDDMLISDKQRSPKGKQVLTQEMSDRVLPAAREFALAHEEATIAFLTNPDMADYFDCGLFDAYYTQNPGADPTPLVEVLKIKNKALRTRAVRLLGGYPGARPMLEELQGAKRKDIREWADKALASLENMNAFVLPGSAGADAAADTSFDLAEFAGKNTPKTAAKLLSFTAPQNWAPVRRADDEAAQVGVDILTCYVCLYAQSKDMQRLFPAEKMRPFLHPKDMQALSAGLYREWLDAGADSKTKGIMTLYGIHGGDEAVNDLKAAVAFFDNRSRSAMAGDAVKALSVSHSTMALVAVDNMARVFRNKLVRRVAGETLAAAAQSMGLTMDQLSDKIVPTLGLDASGKMTLTTGAYDTPGRTFQAVLQGDLKIQLYNDAGKAIKSLPAINPSLDHCEGYELAKSDLSLLKKELKTIVKIQTGRLELSLATRREWPFAEFQELFIANPIMQRFASSLVFGVYRDGVLGETFRYAGDGSYSSAADETFPLGEDARIRIVHPCELTQEQIDAWSAQLGDYEITQPFPQINRPVYRAAQGDGDTYTGLAGTDFSVYAVAKLIGNYHWIRRTDGDAGSYDCIYCEDSTTGLSARLDFSSPLDIVEGAETNTTLSEITFYNTNDARGRFGISPTAIIPPAQLPAHFFSEVIYQIRSVLSKKKS